MQGNINKDHKKRAFHRLKIIAGQVQGLANMLEKEKYCVDILNQSLAIQESLKSFEALILENHLLTHIISGKVKDKKSAVKELTTLYRLKNR